jgi:microcystin-dependent protein
MAPNTVTIGIAGGSQPHNNMQPYLGMNYIIAIEGIYPSRN